MPVPVKVKETVAPGRFVVRNEVWDDCCPKLSVPVPRPVYATRTHQQERVIRRRVYPGRSWLILDERARVLNL